MASVVEYAHARLPANVGAFFKTIDFRQERRQLVDAHAEANRQQRAVTLYPSLDGLDQTQQMVEVIRAAMEVYERESVDETMRRRWLLKFRVAPRFMTQEVLARIGKGLESYRELVEDTPRAVGRLVALNIANALIHHKVHAIHAQDYDLTTFPATADYVNGRRFHSLIPLASAYAPRRVFESLPEAAARMFVVGKIPVSESSVQEELQALVSEIVQ